MKNNMYKDGYHLNSKYWQEKKNKIPNINNELIEIALGMIISDACMYKKSKNAIIKFEQGYKQKEFINNLFEKFKLYSWMDNIQIRYKNNQIKSYWFKTFSHLTFNELWNLFYKNEKKKYKKGLIKNHFTWLSLAYWIMSDGSNNKGSLNLHTENFTKVENKNICKELNEKFNINSLLSKSKNKYYIRINIKDSNKIKIKIKKYIIESMIYKIK
jgi:hypothetical protein